MTDYSWLWIVFTVLAAAGQTVRNAMQRELTATLGTTGATHVRFLFGFPFSVIFLLGLMLVTGASLPKPPVVFWPWIIDGMGAQIIATALMLAAMGERSFVVTIAYIKTEPIQVALFGLIFLGDALSLGMIAAILIATAGVVVMSLKPGGAPSDSWRPTLLGLASGAMFALSAVGYRGAILSLNLSDYVMAATFTLVVGLLLQSVILSSLPDAAQPRCHARDYASSGGRHCSPASWARRHRNSGFWLLRWRRLRACARVALVEVLFAQAISSFVFGQKTSAREGFGIVLIVIGVVLLIWAH